MPTQLFHGSMYEQNELMPGFKRSGKEVEWDGVESNRYLYATTDRETAISQGFASSLEKLFPMERFRTEGDDIHVYIKGAPPSNEQLKKITVYLYTLKDLPHDLWRKNNNKVNGLDTEWVTQNTICDGIVSREPISMATWLNGRSITFYKHVEENARSNIVHQTPLTRFFS